MGLSSMVMSGRQQAGMASTGGRRGAVCAGPAVRRGRLVVALVLGLMVAGCAGQVDRHGHFLSQSDLMQVQPGMTQDEVRSLLGTPDTTSTADGQTFYYIASTSKTSVAFMTPDEVDRQVVAVYFNPIGLVDSVANYGMQDGMVVDFVTRRTPTAAREKSFIERLFKGIGKKKVYDPNAQPS